RNVTEVQKCALPIIDRHNVMLRTGARPNLRFSPFVIWPYIGVGSPVDQYLWVDNLTIATKHPAGRRSRNDRREVGLAVDLPLFYLLRPRHSPRDPLGPTSAPGG